VAYKMSLRWKGKCLRHARYNPEKEGQSGIRGGCRRCQLLFDLYSLACATTARMDELDRATSADREALGTGAEDNQGQRILALGSK
jgi:hypothetical protein